VVAASFLKLEKWEKAAEQARKTLEISADHLDSHFVLILTCHHQKDWKALERHGRAFLRILAEVKSHPERMGFGITHALNEAWRVWLALGDLELERGERRRAEEAFARARAETPSLWECEKKTADCYKSRNLYEEAARHYARALEEKTDHPDALLGLAYATLQLGDRPGAAALYQRILTLQPETVEALIKLGDIHSAMRRPKPARAFYERALLLEPRLVNVSLRLSRLCLEQGDLEGCVSCCEDILRSLGLPSDRRLDSLEDLAGLFLMIAHEMDRYGKPDLFEEAARVALSLNPQLLRTCQAAGTL
jgi:tetratricopeptide (TPR) repeat protein